MISIMSFVPANGMQGVATDPSRRWVSTVPTGRGAPRRRVHPLLIDVSLSQFIFETLLQKNSPHLHRLRLPKYSFFQASVPMLLARSENGLPS
jgi:hypothetical protein